MDIFYAYKFTSINLKKISILSPVLRGKILSSYQKKKMDVNYLGLHDQFIMLTYVKV